VTVSSLLSSALAEAAEAGSLLVATDFDGVLAPLVLDPSTSRPLPGTVDSLRGLAAQPGTYAAVVSGRDLASLGALTGLADQDEVTLIGSHGAESTAAQGGSSMTPEQRDTLDRVTAALEALTPAHPGFWLEHKPTAVVAHTRRMSPDAAPAAEADALEVTTRHTDVHVLHGKQVVEVSVVQADKGTALTGLREALGADALVYFGDDVTDEHVFTRLGDGDVGVKVGDGETAARWRVDSPEDVAQALTLLLERRVHR
jgi:trehalose 6-phosphate phosphatase